MSTHLFRFRGPGSQAIREHVPPGVTATAGPIAPEILLPITLSDDTAIIYLQDGMAGYGWEYVGLAPEG